MVKGAAVVDAEQIAASSEGRVVGQATEGAVDGIRPVVVEDDKLVADRNRRREGGGHVQHRVAKAVRAANIELIVAGAGSWSGKFHEEIAGAGEDHIAAGKNAGTIAGGNVAVGRDVANGAAAVEDQGSHAGAAGVHFTRTAQGVDAFADFVQVQQAGTGDGDITNRGDLRVANQPDRK